MKRKSLKSAIFIGLASIGLIACGAGGGDNPSTSSNPSINPSTTPSVNPSINPSTRPSVTPSVEPSVNPSVNPSVEPSINPSINPSVEPSITPSVEPSVTPSVTPSITPSVEPSVAPSVTPSVTPSVEPSVTPSITPSITPSVTPSIEPSIEPSTTPSEEPIVSEKLKLIDFSSHESEDKTDYSGPQAKYLRGGPRYRDKLQEISYHDVSLEAVVYNEERDSFVDLVLYLSWLDTKVVYNEGHGDYVCSSTTYLDNSQWVTKITINLSLTFDEEFYSLIQIDEINFLHNGTSNTKAMLDDDELRTIEYGYVGYNNISFDDDDSPRNIDYELTSYNYLSRIIDPSHDGEYVNYVNPHPFYTFGEFEAVIVEYATYDPNSEEYNEGKFAVINKIPTDLEEVIIPESVLYSNFNISSESIPVKAVYLYDEYKSIHSHLQTLDIDYEDYSNVRSLYIPDSCNLVKFDGEFENINSISLSSNTKLEGGYLEEFNFFNLSGDRSCYYEEDGSVYLRARDKDKYLLLATPNRSAYNVNDSIYNNMDFYNNLHKQEYYSESYTRVINEGIKFDVGDFAYRASLFNKGEVSFEGLANSVPTEYLETGYLSNVNIPDTISVTLNDNAILMNYYVSSSQLSVTSEFLEAFPYSSKTFDYDVLPTGHAYGTNLPGMRSGSSIINPSAIQTYMTNRALEFNYFKYINNEFDPDAEITLKVTEIKDTLNLTLKNYLGTGKITQGTYDPIEIGNSPNIEETVKHLTIGSNVRTIRSSYLFKDGWDILESGVVIPNTVRAIYAQETNASAVTFESGSQLEYLSLSAMNVKEFIMPDSVTKCYLSLGEDLETLVIGKGLRTLINDDDRRGEAIKTDAINIAKDRTTAQSGVDYEARETYLRFTAGIHHSLKTLSILSDYITEIPDYMFMGFESLRNLTFSSSIKKIGNFSFAFSEALRTLNLNNIEEIGNNAFYHSRRLGTINFGDHLRSIGESAFETCISLDEVEAKVEHIGKYIFKDCESLTSINLVGVKTIGFGAFYNCTELSDIELPSSLEKIDDYAFGETSLVDVSIPSNVILGRFIFNKVTTLNSLIVGDNVTFNSYTFRDANIVNDEMYGSSVNTLKSVTIGANAHFAPSTFENATNLISLTINDEGLKELPINFLRNAANLETLNINGTLERIGDYAFYNCSKLTNLTLNEGLLEIGKFAFTGLPSCNFIIPSTVTFIGDSAFSYDGSISGNYVSKDGYVFIPTNDNPYCYVIYLEGNVTSNLPDTTLYIGQGVFSNYRYASFDFVLPSGLKMISKEAFANFSTGNLYVPDSVIYIGESSFRRINTILTGFDGLREIPRYAFANAKCNELAFSNVEKVDRYAFQGFEGTSLIFDNLKVVEYASFENANNLITLSIPDTIEYFHRFAFGYKYNGEGCPTALLTLRKGCYYLGNETNPYLILYKIDTSKSNIVLSDNVKYICTDALRGLSSNVLFENDGYGDYLPSDSYDYFLLYRYNPTHTLEEIISTDGRAKTGGIIRYGSNTYVVTSAYISDPSKFNEYGTLIINDECRFIYNNFYQYRKFLASDANLHYYDFTNENSGGEGYYSTLGNISSRTKPAGALNIVIGDNVEIIMSHAIDTTETNSGYTTNSQYGIYIANISIGNGVRIIQKDAFVITDMVNGTLMSSDSDDLIPSFNGVITYNGTMSEWNDISLDEHWYTSTLDFVIRCSDGDISYSHNV